VSVSTIWPILNTWLRTAKPSYEKKKASFLRLLHIRFRFTFNSIFKLPRWGIYPRPIPAGIPNSPGKRSSCAIQYRRAKPFCVTQNYGILWKLFKTVFEDNNKASSGSDMETTSTIILCTVHSMMGPFPAPLVDGQVPCTVWAYRPGK